LGNFISLPILFIAAVLQATFVPQVRLLGGGPDLVFLIILSWSINARLEQSIVWTFVGGIMIDLLSAAPTGASVLGMLLVIFAISGIGQQVYNIGILLLVGAVVIGTIIKQAVLFFILTLAGFEIDWMVAAAYIVAPTIVYNLALIWPIYWFMRRIQRRV
jgi:rod shape-determining protein MreD